MITEHISNTWEIFWLQTEFCLQWRNFPQLQWDFQLCEGFSLTEEEISTNRGISSNCWWNFNHLRDFLQLQREFQTFEWLLWLQRKFQLLEGLSHSSEKIPAVWEIFFSCRENFTCEGKISCNSRGNFK